MTDQQIKNKLTKFSRGMGKEEGKLIQDEDAQKIELDPEVLKKAINKIGGKAFWTFMLISYLV